MRNFSTPALSPQLRSLTMTSLVTGLRNLILKSGYSVTRTINAVVTSKIIKRDIHSDQIIFKDPQHMNTEVKRQDALKAVVEFARLTGLDDAGAVFAEIALVPFCYTLCCLQSDKSCLAEVPTIRDLVLTSFGV